MLILTLTIEIVVFSKHFYPENLPQKKWTLHFCSQSHSQLLPLMIRSCMKKPNLTLSPNLEVVGDLKGIFLKIIDYFSQILGTGMADSRILVLSFIFPCAASKNGFK